MATSAVIHHPAAPPEDGPTRVSRVARDFLLRSRPAAPRQGQPARPAGEIISQNQVDLRGAVKLRRKPAAPMTNPRPDLLSMPCVPLVLGNLGQGTPGSGFVVPASVTPGTSLLPDRLVFGCYAPDDFPLQPLRSSQSEPPLNLKSPARPSRACSSPRRVRPVPAPTPYSPDPRRQPRVTSRHVQRADRMNSPRPASSIWMPSQEITPGEPCPQLSRRHPAVTSREAGKVAQQRPMHPACRHPQPGPGLRRHSGSRHPASFQNAGPASVRPPCSIVSALAAAGLITHVTSPAGGDAVSLPPPEGAPKLGMCPESRTQPGLDSKTSKATRASPVPRTRLRDPSARNAHRTPKPASHPPGPTQSPHRTRDHFGHARVTAQPPRIGEEPIATTAWINRPPAR